MVGTGLLVENNNKNSTVWPRLKSFIYLPKRCILQHGKAFKILIPSGLIPCPDENDAPTYSEGKKEQKRTK